MADREVIQTFIEVKRFTKKKGSSKNFFSEFSTMALLPGIECLKQWEYF